MFQHLRAVAIIGFFLLACATLCLMHSAREAALGNLTLSTEKTLLTSHATLQDWWLTSSESGSPQAVCAEAASNQAYSKPCRQAIGNFTALLSHEIGNLPVPVIIAHNIKGGKIYSAFPPGVSRPLQDELLQPAMKGEAAFMDKPAGGELTLLLPVLQKACATGQACSDSANGTMVEIHVDLTDAASSVALFYYSWAFAAMALMGGLIWYLVAAFGKAETVIGNQYDSQRSMELALKKSEEEVANKTLFLANVSHELRTPLNAIIGFSEFIRSEHSGPIGSKIYLEYIQDINSSGIHLLSLINDILDYSKAESNKLELRVEDTDVAKTVQNCVRLISASAEKAQVKTLTRIGEGDFALKTDARRMKQIMLNLLSNAVKFTPAGGTVTVSMWENLADKSVSIEVKDSGVGIAPKDIPRALMPFGQIDNTVSHKHEGTGLGLPITKKFTEVMGGTFNIVSELTKGTSITITLPRITPQAG